MIRVAWIFLAALALVAGQTPSRDCEGGFDVYLVLDHSRSTIQCRNTINAPCESGADCRCTNQFVSNVADLVTSIVEEFGEQKDFRLQITIFGTAGIPFLPLTGSKAAMAEAVKSLRSRVNPNGAGWTHMEKAMDVSVNILQNQPPEIFKLLFLVTDGDNTGHPGQMQYYADQVRAVDGMVFSVGISEPPQSLTPGAITLLRDLANKPPGYPNVNDEDNPFFITTPSFAELKKALSKLNSTKECFSITSVAPCTVDDFCCAPYSTDLVVITGENFNPPIGMETNVSCRYETWVDTGEVDELTEEPIMERKFFFTQGVRISDTRLECETPNDGKYVFNNLTKIEVRLVDDDSFQYSISGNVLYVYPADNALCIPVAATFPYWALLLAIPFILFLLWFFFPAMPKKKKIVQSTEDIMVPPEVMQTIAAPITPPVVPLAPPPEPPPAVKKKVRKWAKVDTSHYIWSRDGGSARPMEVAWGNSGAPESAPVRDAADIQFDVIQDGPTTTTAAPVAAPPIQPVAPAPMIDTGGTADEADFSDMEWDRCCCGMCASDSCSCCKSIMARTFQFLFFVSACLGSIFKRCCKAIGMYQCYVALDKMRPRWDCCGVNKGQPKDDPSAPVLNRQDTSSQAVNMTEMTTNPASKSNGLPAGWEEFKSDEGHTYYYNQKLDLSQYERPT